MLSHAPSHTRKDGFNSRSFLSVRFAYSTAEPRGWCTCWSLLRLHKWVFPSFLPPLSFISTKPLFFIPFCLLHTVCLRITVSDNLVNTLMNGRFVHFSIALIPELRTYFSRPIFPHSCSQCWCHALCQKRQFRHLFCFRLRSFWYCFYSEVPG